MIWDGCGLKRRANGQRACLECLSNRLNATKHLENCAVQGNKLLCELGDNDTIYSWPWVFQCCIMPNITMGTTLQVHSHLQLPVEKSLSGVPQSGDIGQSLTFEPSMPVPVRDKLTTNRRGRTPGDWLLLPTVNGNVESWQCSKGNLHYPVDWSASSWRQRTRLPVEGRKGGSLAFLIFPTTPR